MKIANIVTETGEILFATPTEAGLMKVEGSLESGWKPSGIQVTAEKFLPPVDPAVIFGIGLNYRAHALEMGKPLPEFPVVFMKNPAAATGHRQPVFLPRFLKSEMVDYEVELAVIIGKTCKNIQPEDALDYVAGYTVANDVSARDWQNIYGGGQWSRAKTFDSFCPLGPYLVTSDEIPDPNQLALRLELNGEVMQSSNTSDMIFDVRELVTFLSGSTTLPPGTVILTGTPPGVGAAAKPPRFLRAGDHMNAVIESVGELENPVLEESL